MMYWLNDNNDNNDNSNINDNYNDGNNYNNNNINDMHVIYDVSHNIAKVREYVIFTNSWSYYFIVKL